jgi:MerR family transcriptional regulator, heat shock protein HspR
MPRKKSEQLYVISAAAKILGIRTHTLRYYEKIGIIQPFRSKGNIRLYSENEIAYIKHVMAMAEELGVNLVGVEVILRMAQRLNSQQRRIEELEAQLQEARGKQERHD